jgi:hypothetical protein
MAWLTKLPHVEKGSPLAGGALESAISPVVAIHGRESVSTKKEANAGTSAASSKAEHGASRIDRDADFCLT